jgi:hypothetical protein
LTDWLQQLEQTSFFAWVSGGGSIWGYPTILFLHTLGLATVAGLSAAISLRILGFAPGVALGPLTRFFPLIWTAFGVTAVSGTILLLADGTTKLANPVFYVKMALIAVALVVLQMIRTRVLGDPLVDSRPVTSTGRLLSIASLFLWIAATTAGRLMAYVGPVSGLE